MNYHYVYIIYLNFQSLHIIYYTYVLAIQRCTKITVGTNAFNDFAKTIQKFDYAPPFFDHANSGFDFVVAHLVESYF